MVAFAMTKEASAELLKDVLEKNPPPCGYFPHMFACMCQLHGIDQDADEIEELGRMCGIAVLAVPMPSKAA